MNSGRPILIICSGLNYPGGIERAIVNTANLLNGKGYSVHLLVLNESGSSFYPVNESVIITTRSLHFGITQQGNFFSRKVALAKHIIALRRVIRAINPSALITTEYVQTIATRLAFIAQPKVPLFSWEHHHYNGLRKNRFWALLQKIVYPSLTAVVCLNGEEAAYFKKIGCHPVVIPNFIYASQAGHAIIRNKTVLTIGWLTTAKGADYLPRIAAAVLLKHADWQWEVVGKGSEKEWLLNQVAERGLQGRLIITEPNSSEIDHLYQQARLFVLLSRVECLPMVLLEAMGQGLPVIAFDCPTGPRHIIEDGKNGMLVQNGNEEAMIAAINRCIEDEALRSTLSSTAQKTIARFDPEVIYCLWKQLLFPDVTAENTE